MPKEELINIAKPFKKSATLVETNLRYTVVPIAPVILFPGHVLTLNDLDSFSADEWRKAKAGKLKFLVVPTLAVGEQDVCQALAGVGTEAVVTDVIDLPKGRKGLVVRGTRRMILREVYKVGNRVIAKADAANDLPFRRTTKFNATVSALRNSIADVIKLNSTYGREVATILAATDEPDALINLISPHITISFEERISLLASFSTLERMTLILGMLGKEYDLLQVASKIKDAVQNNLKEYQKKIFLHEQIRAIKSELGEGHENELEVLSGEIQELKLSKLVLETVSRELERMELMPPGSPEYMVSFTFVTWIRDLPWGELVIPEIPSLEDANAQLDVDHYGLSKVKERILEYLAVMKHRGSSKGEVLLLAGPPGVGKTSLGRSIAKSLNRPFERISLGGMRDESEIRGHRRTYIGSMPGKLITAIKNSGTRAPVILLDEIDKVGSDQGRGDVTSALLEVLDQEQNSTFTDHYLGVPYDLSQVVFICTANALDTIPAALMDRMELIELPSYTDPEKIAIAKKHLIPLVRKDLKLKVSEFGLSDKVVKELILGFTREAGVRQLRRVISSLARKSLTKMQTGKEFKINHTNLNEWLGHSKFQFDRLENTVIPGVATGLAWTRVGGDVLVIESNKVLNKEGKGQLKLTGSLGKVMQESVQAAFTCLQSYADANPDLLSFSTEDLNSHNIHIHFPDGATPKDGPSAGIAILTAITSLFADKAMPRDMAMTGEISLRGRVLPVGGIREKLMAAHRLGKKKIIMPMQNRHDLDELPEDVRDQLEISLVSRMEEVLQLTKLLSTSRKGFDLNKVKRQGATSAKSVLRRQPKVRQNRETLIN
jgi:ATP-dependent Lon protease